VGEDDPALVCSSVTPSTRGVWYILQGDDRRFTASTEGSEIDAFLAVYITTAGCESLVCLDQTKDPNDLTRKAYWATTTGVDYYILLAGYSDKTGGYTLTVMVRQHNAFIWCCLMRLIVLRSLCFNATGRRRHRAN